MRIGRKKYATVQSYFRRLRDRYTIILIVGLVAGTGLNLNGQTEVVDTIPSQARSFSPEVLDAYLNDSDFSYPDRGRPASNLWSEFWRWVLSLFPKVTVDGSWGGVLKIALYIISGLAIVYAVLQLLGINPAQLIGKNAGSQVQYAEEIEDIHGIDFEQQINRAVANQAYREAVRLCYLWALKKLDDQQYIDWRPGKTNHDYLSELDDPALRKKISYLVYLYEYTWYGDFPADEGLYHDARQRVEQLRIPQPARI